MSELLLNKPGHTALLLGNEGFVRGALEAGLAYASCYPGTPSSEVPNTLYAIQDQAGLYMEFATNEKVAMEAAGGAAIAGVRSLTTMKHVGMNVASDPMMTLAYTGIRGALVIYNADDPGMHSSQNEQDNRYFAKFSGLPMLEPADAQEMKDMTVFAFELSEQLQTPVIVRSTTRVAHSRGAVVYGEMTPVQPKGRFEKDPMSLVALPATTPAMHKRLLEKQDKAENIANTSTFNTIIGNGEFGIICSSVSRSYCADAVEELGLTESVSILNLGFTNPLPEKLITEFLIGKSKVLIVEELEPYLEDAVRIAAQKHQITCEIAGKGIGRLSRLLEYDPAMVREAIAIYFTGQTLEQKPLDLADVPVLPRRPPNLCAGCPHRMTYYAAKQAAPKDTIFSNDIGCYTLGFFPPYQMVDCAICMGASVSMPSGYDVVTDQHTIAFIGDSTFFHSGMTGLANAVFNNHKFVLIILDNSITAMTGHQPSPAMDVSYSKKPKTHIEIENVVRGLGVENVQVVKPKNLKKTQALIEDALQHDGVSVIISREPCPLHVNRLKKRKKVSFTIDQNICKQHKKCISDWACPAFYMDDKKVLINQGLCNGCAVCVQLCTEGAIKINKEQE
ncbi:indolepyruvate ferredoxin oxidoreductase subunit alpha [Desulfosediminicola flagellatus]|uniref:indolepyruvate ferredoxin oxidoreductase subunit alpha n=1 Tax=Desulfosediminicola flagellatus TaxID=2569541 RepID=UPI0010ABE2BF|nr:indolepyruvate ferredoxin oxidoreductase subunit alpha [Desulfosediminicola flagellatus]